MNYGRLCGFGGLVVWAIVTVAGCGSAPKAYPETASVQSAPAAPAGKIRAGKYVGVDEIDPRAVLPDPSAPGSPLTKGELEVIKAAQEDAKRETRTRTLAEDGMTPSIFGVVLGSGFDLKAMPRTAAILNQVTKDAAPISERAKNTWKRPRPFVQEPGLTVLTERPDTFSYPSGHALRAALWARVLAQFAPELSAALSARARLVMLDRMVAGVHFPTDVAAGFALGNAIADRVVESPAFKEDFQAARAEWKR